MVDEKKVKLLEEKVKDKDFIESILALDTNKEVVDALSKEGIDFTEEDVEIIKNMVVKKLQSSAEGDELSDADLEDVAGGFVITASALATLGLITTSISATAGAGTLVHNLTRGRW